MNYEVNTGYKWWSPSVKTRDIHIAVSSLFSSFSSIFFFFILKLHLFGQHNLLTENSIHIFQIIRKVCGSKTHRSNWFWTINVDLICFSMGSFIRKKRASKHRPIGCAQDIQPMNQRKNARRDVWRKRTIASNWESMHIVIRRINVLLNFIFGLGKYWLVDAQYRDEFLFSRFILEKSKILMTKF